MVIVRKFEIISDAGGICATEINVQGLYFI
jgi:hypothetical protein